MKLFIHTCLLTFIGLAGCNLQPSELSAVTETIEVSYIHWACNCADFIETKYYKNNPSYEVKEENCIYLEAADKEFQIPEDFYQKGHFTYSLKLRGHYYLDQGVPDSYDRKTPDKPEKAKVFRYDSYVLVKKQ